jgi:hypothetical protein
MKKTINIIALIVGLSFFFTGCYTIVWDPREEYPDTESYTESSGFYETDYYGGYGSYYETPWWIGSPVFVTYPGGGPDNGQTKERNNGRNIDTENIRNSGGRGNTDRNPVVTTPTPTRNTTTGTGSSDNSNTVTTPPPTRDSSSGSTNTSTSNTRSSNSNNARNNSGSRNSGSGRK